MSEVNSIFKYTKINKMSLSNLKHNALYAQSPDRFNDPYEFIFRFEVPDEQLIEFLKLIYGTDYIVFLERNIPKKDILEYSRDHYFSEHRNGIGATCFTEDARTELFWAHYGDNHKGMCLEFNRDKYPFDKSIKVKYVKEVPVITYQDLISTEERLSEVFTNLCLTKSDVWSYESEWRILTEANSLIPYDSDSILSITFGFFCPEELKQQVIDTTAHLSIQYYEIVRAKDSYSIQRALIT